MTNKVKIPFPTKGGDYRFDGEKLQLASEIEEKKRLDALAPKQSQPHHKKFFRSAKDNQE